MKKMIGILLTVILLLSMPQAVYAGQSVSAPDITVSLKESTTTKHRTIAVSSRIRIRAKLGEKTVKCSKLIFRSANPSVASVNSKGLVRTKAVGETSIIVSTKDGKNKAVLRLTVTKSLFAWSGPSLVAGQSEPGDLVCLSMN